MQGKETQQGYVLAFSLILLAFASIILISALERTGIEKRIATSELHRATLEAAAEAGSFAFVQALDEKHLDPLATPRNNCETMVDFLWDLDNQEVNADLDLAKLLEPENTSGALGEGVEGNPREFRAQSHAQPLVSWWIDLDPDVVEDSVGASLAEVKVGCQAEPYRVPFVVKSQVGSLDAPQAILAVGAQVQFENDISDPLDQILGAHAAQASGRLRVDAGGQIEGHAAAKRIEIDGGAGFNANNPDTELRLGYGDIQVPDWYASNPPAWHVDYVRPRESYRPPKSDPLKLAKWLVDAQTQPHSGVPLTTAPVMHVRTELAAMDSAKEIGAWPFQQARLTLEPDGIHFEVYDDREGIKEWVTLSGLPADQYYAQVSPALPTEVDRESSSALFALQDLKLNAGGPQPTLAVQGGDITLYVRGDVHFAGGTKIRIAPDSSLTLIVEGQVDIGSGFQFDLDRAEPYNAEGRRYFTLLSTNTSEQAVILRSDSRVYGAIYSLGDVRLLEGGSVHGQVYGRDILVTGGTGIDASGLDRQGTKIRPVLDFEY